MKHLPCLFLLTIIGVTVSACQDPQGTITPQVVTMPVGVTTMNSVVAFPNGRLVVSDTQTIWYRDGDSDPWRILSLIDRPPCLRLFLQLAALPDQRLGFICPVGTVNQRFIYTLVAYDWTTDTLGSLVPDPLPDNGYFSWNNVMTRGVFANVDAFSTLYWIESDTAQSIPATIAANGKLWFLPDSVDARADWVRDPRQFEGHHPVGLVRLPVWSPTQDTIAFWATLEPIGQQYELRLYLYTLYFMDANTLRITPVLERIRNPLTLKWAFDGTRLAYSTEVGGSQAQGLWVYSLKTGKNTLILKGKYLAVAWTPNSKGLYAVRCTNDCLSQQEALFFDLQPLAD